MVVPVLASLAGIYLVYRCIVVWREGALAGRMARIRYTIVSLCALFMCWFYYYWNILGWQYMS